MTELLAGYALTAGFWSLCDIFTFWLIATETLRAEATHWQKAVGVPLYFDS
jgi:hypothetical protein